MLVSLFVINYSWFHLWLLLLVALNGIIVFWLIGNSGSIHQDTVLCSASVG